MSDALQDMLKKIKAQYLKEGLCQNKDNLLCRIGIHKTRGKNIFHPNMYGDSFVGVCLRCGKEKICY